MTADWIALMLGCALFAVVNAATALALWAAWPLARRRLARGSSAVRASLVFLWRLMPLAVSAAATVAATAAFVVHEPRGAAEPVGILLRILAILGGTLSLVSVGRLAWVLGASEWLAFRWTRDGAAIELPGAGGPTWLINAEFPIVAVVGVWRPRLVMARSVVRGCSRDELAAMAAHERGHMGAADNLRRLCLQSAVDLLAMTRQSRVMNACWQEAAEEAADDYAAAHGVRAVDLAAALVSVARLATDRPAIDPLPASVFYRGGGVERRVRRLLAGGAPPGSPAGRPWFLPLALGLATAVAGLIMTGAGRTIHHGAEWLVRSLP